MADTLTAKLTKVSAAVGAVGKTGKNEKQGYNFRGIDAVVNAVGPALRAEGISCLPEVLSADYGTVEVGQNRTPMSHVRVIVRYRFTDGLEHLDAIVPGEAMDSGDKATAKAMSVAFRTCLLQTLCLPTDEADPDEHSYERAGETREVNPRHPAAKPSTGGATPAQLNAIRTMAKKAGELPPIGLEEMTKSQASDAIQALQAKLAAPATDEEPF